MFSLLWAAFVAVFAAASVFFVFAKRRFDFLTVAFIGAAFYFSPLLFGYVLQSGPYDPAIPESVYWIGAGYMAALPFAAIVSDRFLPEIKPNGANGRSVSFWYLGIAIVGLVGSLIQSRGAIIDIDKLEVLKHVGYLYSAFEIAACLAFLSAINERRLWPTIAAGILLLVDVFLGFRFYIVFTFLATPLVLTRSEGKIQLWRKIPTYGLATIAFVVAILLANSARLAVFNMINPEAVTEARKMRGDTIQFIMATGLHGPGWIMAPVRIYMQSEPFLTQSVLVDIARTGVSCKPANILKSVYLLVPPGFTSLFPSPYPPTFYDEYQPILFPGLTYGLGGNIWAEMLCRFGYQGDAVLVMLMIVTLTGLFRLFLRFPTTIAIPISVAGVIVAFYIHRNDLHYTLVMLRQTWLVAAAALLISYLVAKRRAPRLTAQQGS